MTTKEEAFAVLEKKRPSLVEPGRIIAEQLIRRDGSTHSRKVFQEMDARGYPVRDVDARWLGIVFQSSQFKTTGEIYEPTEADYSNTKGDTHLRGRMSGIQVWTLA